MMRAKLQTAVRPAPCPQIVWHHPDEFTFDDVPLITQSAGSSSSKAFAGSNRSRRGIVMAFGRFGRCPHSWSCMGCTAGGLYGALIALPLSLANLASPIIIEFVFGMLMGLAYRELKCS